MNSTTQKAGPAVPPSVLNIEPMAKEAKLALHKNLIAYDDGKMTFAEYIRAQFEVIGQFERRCGNMFLYLSE